MDSVIATLLILGTPAVAIAGGILAGILRMRGQQRLLELAQRERLAAIERGVDITKLAPLVFPNAAPTLTPRQSAMKKAQGMTIGGLLTLALGIGLSLTLLMMPAHDGGDAWPIGFVPIFMGIALLLSARIVRAGVEE